MRHNKSCNCDCHVEKDTDKCIPGEVLNAEMQGILRRYARNSSAHGLPRLARSRSILGRIFWSATCLIAFGFFIGYGLSLLNRYTSYPKSMTLDVVDGAIQFPAITICNLRGLDVYTLGDVMYNSNQTWRWDIGDDPHYGGRDNSTVPAFEQLITRYGSRVRAYNRFAKLYTERGEDANFMHRAERYLLSRMTIAANLNVTSASEGGVQRDEFIAYCEYGGEPCSHDKFTKFIDPTYFSCFTFDLSTQSEQVETVYEGVNNGLSVILFVPGIKVMNYSRQAAAKLAINNGLTVGGEGVRVVVHARNTIPFPLTDGLDIPRGVSAAIGISASEHRRLGSPHGNCTDQSSISSKLNYSYSLSTCRNMCLQRMVVRVCGCSDTSLPLPEDNDTTTCASFDDLPEYCLTESDVETNFVNCTPHFFQWFDRIKCMRSARANISRNMSSLRECDCRNKCREVGYQPSYSLSDWPMKEQSRDFVRGILLTEKFLDNFPPAKANQYFGHLSLETNDTSDESIEPYIQFITDGNFVRLNVFMADSSLFRIVEQEAYGLTHLASDVGGQLSLWVGVSVITVVELVELLISVTKACLEHRGERKEKQEEPGKWCRRRGEELHKDNVSDVRTTSRHGMHPARDNTVCASEWF